MPTEQSIHTVSFDGLVLPNPLTGPRLGSILHPQDGREKPESHYTTGAQAEVDNRYTLSDQGWTRLQVHAARHRAKGNKFGFSLCGQGDISRTLTAHYSKGGSEILIRQRGKNPRRLTPRECARLMGFDRPDKPSFKIPVSDTQAYKQFGNAVVVPVAEAVARHMEAWLLA